MKLKWAASVLGLILPMVMWGGCAVEEKTDTEELRAGVLVYNQDDLFIQSVQEELDECFRKTEKEEGCRITVSFFDSMGSQLTQNEQIDTFIENGYDVLCVNLVDRTDAATIIDKGKSADVPIVFFNREPVNADLERWDRIYYVGTDAAEGGKLQGEIFLDYYEEHREEVDKNGDGIIQYVLLEGEPGHQDAAIRTESCIKRIKEGGAGMERLAGSNANWKLNQGKEKMEAWLQEFGDKIEAVISNNDAMALGALDALGEEKWSGIQAAVIGLDGIEEARAAIQEKRMIGTVINDAEGQAEAIVELALQLGRGEAPEDIPGMEKRVIRLPYDLLTQ